MENDNMLPKVEEKKGNIGSIIGIIIILAILIIAAFYIWGNKVVQAPPVQQAPETAEQIIDETAQDLSDIDLNIDLDLENI